MTVNKRIPFVSCAIFIIALLCNTFLGNTDIFIFKLPLMVVFNVFCSLFLCLYYLFEVYLAISSLK